MSEPIRAGAPVEAIEVLERWFGDKGEEGRKFYGAIAAEMFEPTPEMIAAGARTLELVWQEISDARPIVRSIYAAILAARE